MASPAPQVTSATPAAKPKDDPLTAQVRKECARHFPGSTQGELRTSCVSSVPSLQTLGKSLAETKCRVTYGLEPRTALSCLIGVAIADDIAAKREDYKKKLQLCAEQYPQYTEIDAFLQESCLTGVHLPELITVGSQNRLFETCAQISPERSFLGPCAVGLSLAQGMAQVILPNQQNKLCEQYFDHRKFHLTYRACLNATSVAIVSGANANELIKNCENILSDPGNDNERAACIVGTNIHRALTKQEDLSKRFQKCGENKVSYEDRDVLACLTASSLLELTDRSGATVGCKDIFKAPKNSSRSDCLNSMGLF
jgi:hypothetical protein